jgi:hypothetical protein
MVHGELDDRASSIRALSPNPVRPFVQQVYSEPARDMPGALEETDCADDR